MTFIYAGKQSGEIINSPKIIKKMVDGKWIYQKMEMVVLKNSKMPSK